MSFEEASREPIEPSIPDGYMSLSQYAERFRETNLQAEFEIRSAADDITRFDHELARAVPEIGTPPPLYETVVDKTGEKTVYFSAYRVGELVRRIVDKRPRRET